MKKLILIVAISLLLGSCMKDNFLNSGNYIDIKNLIGGAWVETSQKTDTLIFIDQSTLLLNRGIEMSGGYQVPKAPSGFYRYEIDNNNILLHWVVSSNSNGENYLFKLDLVNDKIQVGNFFMNSKSKDAILTFSRVYL